MIDNLETEPAPVSIDSDVVLSRGHAQAYAATECKRQASSCVLLAVVTSSNISAELIDQAIELRHPSHAAPTTPHAEAFAPVF